MVLEKSHQITLEIKFLFGSEYAFLGGPANVIPCCVNYRVLFYLYLYETFTHNQTLRTSTQNSTQNTLKHRYLTILS